MRRHSQCSQSVRMLRRSMPGRGIARGDATRVRETRTAAAEALPRACAQTVDETIHRSPAGGDAAYARSPRAAARGDGCMAHKRARVHHAPPRSQPLLALCLPVAPQRLLPAQPRGCMRRVRRRNFAPACSPCTPPQLSPLADGAHHALRPRARPRRLAPCVARGGSGSSVPASSVDGARRSRLALRSWHRFTLRRTRRSLMAHQDRALRDAQPLVGLGARGCARFARHSRRQRRGAVNALCALGGGWAGGRGAVEIAPPS